MDFFDGATHRELIRANRLSIGCRRGLVARGVSWRQELEKLDGYWPLHLGPCAVSLIRGGGCQISVRDLPGREKLETTHVDESRLIFSQHSQVFGMCRHRSCRRKITHPDFDDAVIALLILRQQRRRDPVALHIVQGERDGQTHTAVRMPPVIMKLPLADVRTPRKRSERLDLTIIVLSPQRRDLHTD